MQSIYGWDIKSSNCLWRSNGTVATLEKCPPFSNDGVTRNGDVPLDEHDDMSIMTNSVNSVVNQFASFMFVYTQLSVITSD